MKKIITSLIILCLAFILYACGAETDTFTVITPAGAPAIAQVFIQDNEDYEVDIVNGPDPLVSAFGSGSHDFIFAPINLGAKLYTSGVEYRFLAAVTFGNYYLMRAVQEDDFTLDSLAGKTIVVFGQNTPSDITLRYVLSENDIEATFTYVDSVATANGALMQSPDTIILTAEPSASVLSGALSSVVVQTIDLQAEYEKLTGSEGFPQAGVFVKNDVSEKAIERFLDDLENSVDQVNNNTDLAIEKTIAFNYGFEAIVLHVAIPNCHIDFITAVDVRSELEAYFEIILEQNPSLIGNALPEDGFYYQS